MSTKLQVLVIDDDAVVGRSFDRVLSEQGYEVVTALSGEDALNTMNERNFDVVFTDINMPGMDGLEVAGSIKARCPWTPVVVITGYGSQENEDRASVLGVNGFVRKPLTPQVIESITLKAVSEAETQTLPEEPKDVIAGLATEEIKATGSMNNIRALAKSITMFAAAPFIALAYIIALPFIGFYQFAKLAFEAYSKKHPTAARKLGNTRHFLKNVGLFLVSPFIALAYIVALPFVGFFMFTKLAIEAHAKRQLNV